MSSAKRNGARQLIGSALCRIGLHTNNAPFHDGWWANWLCSRCRKDLREG